MLIQVILVIYPFFPHKSASLIEHTAARHLT